MADRRTSVSLELKSTQFKAEADASKVKVEGLDRSVEKLDRDITKIPPDAAKAGAALRLLGDESGKTGVALEDGVGRGSTSLGVLDQKLQAARLEVRRLADEFNTTGNATSLEKLFASDKALKDLERFRRTLVTDLSQGVETGITTGAQEGTKNASAALQGGLSNPVIGPALVAGITAAAIAAAPAVGSAISSAVLLGVGGGLLGVGALVQKNDPAIVSAFGGLKTDITRVFQDATSPLVAPFARALRDIDDAVRGMEPSLKPLFAALEPLVQPLTQGLIGFVQNLLPGLTSSVNGSAPVIQQLADSLPGLASSLSKFLESMAKSGPGAAKFLHDALNDVGALIVITGKLIEWLSEAYLWMANTAHQIDAFFSAAAAGITNVWHQVEESFLTAVGIIIDGAARAFGWVPGLGPKLKAAATEFDGFRDRVNGSLDGIKDKYVKVEVNLTGSGAKLVTAGDTTLLSGTGVKFQRWGGIHEHAETGLLNAGVYSSATPARYAFAEPATGGEAFIPKNGDMGRSRDIWSYVGRNWLGMGGGASTPAPVVNVIVSPKDGAIGALVDLIDVRVEYGNHATAAAVAGGPRL